MVVKTRWFAVLGPAYAALWLGWASLDPAPAVVLRGPYVQCATSESAVLVLRTDRPIDVVVRYGTDPADLDFESEAADVVGPTGGSFEADSRLHSAEAVQYEVLLDQMDPDETYFYEVLDGDDVIAGGDSEHFVCSTPDADVERPLNFWVVGDSGTGQRDQAEVFRALQTLREARPLPLDGFVHVGDMAYPNGKDAEFQRNFFDVYQPLLRQTVCWPTMGNHEGHTSNGPTATGPYYDAYVVPTDGEAGGVPSDTEAYYSFDIGHVHFVCLNSHDADRSADAAMARWLVEDLSETDARWLIAFWHHPPYTKGTHDSDREVQLIEMRREIMPILEDAGVDLVLSGHSHIYERSMLIDGAYATPSVADGVVLDDRTGDPNQDGAYMKPRGLVPRRGTLAVVTGHGGAGIGRNGTIPFMRQTIVEHGSVLLEITPTQLTGTMLDRDGRTRDTFALEKSRSAKKRRALDHPWHPDGPRITVSDALPGEAVEVVLEARPDARDAVVHFTVDGSEPTADSPVYRTPLALRDVAQVRAITRWDERTTPVATANVEPLAANVRRYRVDRGENDAEELLSDGTVTTISSDLELGEDGGPQRVGLRFEGLDVPSADAIESARLYLFVKDATTRSTELTLFGERSLGSVPFRVEPHNLTLRPRTDAEVAWAPGPWLLTTDRRRGQRETSPDIGPILREITSQHEWHVGGTVVLFLEGVGLRRAWSYEGRAQQCAILEVVLKEAP